MQREWYLIDDDGIHPLDLSPDSPDELGAEYSDGDEAPWPPFNQVIVQASPTAVIEAMDRTAPELGIEPIDVTEQPDRWDDSVILAGASGDLTAIGEPGVDLDDRVVALPWTESLVAELQCDGAFFGYDPAAQTLHLTRFADGVIDFAWADSLVPGPSYAMIFDENGEATNEDPRRFALRRLEIPDTSPFLDRYRFVTAELEQLGVEEVHPRLEALPVVAAVTVGTDRDVEDGRGSSR